MVQLQLNPTLGGNDHRRSYDYNLLTCPCVVRPTSNIDLSIGPSYAYQVKDAQWVDMVEEEINGGLKNTTSTGN